MKVSCRYFCHNQVH